MPPLRVLAIDGGGVRGVVPAVLLRRLLATPGLEGWLDGVRLLAGTSTGGVLALGLAAGLSPQALQGLYVRRGPEIFRDSPWEDVRSLGRLLGPDYDDANLRRVLREELGERRLGDLPRRVLVTAFDLDNEDPDPARRRWKPKVFHNYPGPDSDGDVPVWKAACYTSAAPTFFAAQDGYVDGGVFAPNPSLCALAQTQDARTGEAVPLGDVALLSLGTGTPLRHLPARRFAGGLLRWARPLLDVMFEGVTGIADFQCARLLGARYHRLEPLLPPGEPAPLDGVDRIPWLVDLAERIDLGPTIDWIRRGS